MFEQILDRLKEPSTYAGLFFVVRAFAPHLSLSPDQIKAIEMVGETLAGMGLVLAKEQKPASFVKPSEEVVQK